MKEKLMERLNRKLSNFCETNIVAPVIDYRYGELTGILDTMMECNMIGKAEYNDLLKLINYIYDTQRNTLLERINRMCGE